VNRSRGFSLLETLAALALLALLLLGVTAALQTMTNATRAGMARTERLDEVRAAQGYLHRALAGAMPYPWSLTRDRTMVVFRGDSSELVFVAPGPGYLEAKGLQLQRLKIVGSGESRRLELAFSPLALRGGSPVVPSGAEVLMDDVVTGRFTYSGTDNQGHPVTWLDSWPYPGHMPTMVGVELVLKGGVHWPVLAIPLRMDPAAVNGREGMARLTLFAKP
jgi:general secretion pathway protein J